jgi:hypothetical protein
MEAEAVEGRSRSGVACDVRRAQDRRPSDKPHARKMTPLPTIFLLAKLIRKDSILKLAYPSMSSQAKIKAQACLKLIIRGVTSLFRLSSTSAMPAC